METVLRIPTYLSYSALATYEKNIEEYYLRNLSETRAPRMPQERPASVGSAFDAYVKADLYNKLFGKDDPKYDLDALFEAQVEPHNRDWAREEGQYIFDSYIQSGRYEALFELLRQSIEPPRFEFEVRANIMGVPFLGKPDCRFVLPGVKVIHDFKVNGYCSASATSPTKGYMICFDGYKSDKPSKSHGTTHKQFQPLEFGGLTIDQGYIEDCSTSWADQLSLYGWALGERIGDEKVVLSIDQIVAKPLPAGRPLLRVASYRARVRQSYQQFLAKRLQTAWDVINSGWIFRDLSREDSDIRCRMLDDQAVTLQSDGSQLGEWFNEVVRPSFRG